MARYKAAQVTVVSGEDIVRVVSGESVAAISEGDNLEIEQFNGVEILGAYTEGGTDDQLIQLVDVWPHANQTLKSAFVVQLPATVSYAVIALNDAKTKVFAHLASFFDFGSQASGTVTFKGVGVGDSDVTIRCINQWGNDIAALESQASGAVGNVNAIDLQVNGAGGLVEVVGSIDATLQGYVSSANTDATKSQEYAMNPYSVVVTNTTNYSSLHYATNSNNASVIAVQAKADTVGLKGDVETLKTDTTTIYNNAFALSDTAVDVKISAGVFSFKHYLAKTQEASAAAIGAVSSVTSGLYMVGAWDASGNAAPPAPLLDAGSPMYKVSVGGVIDGITYDVNDNIIFDRPNSTNNGTNWTLEKWFKIDNTESVVTVNGQSGVVTIGVADIAGLQTTLDTLQNAVDSKVAQAAYDSAQVTIDARLKEIEQDLTIKQWSLYI